MKKIIAVLLMLVMVMSSNLYAFGNEDENIQVDGENGSEKRLLIVYKEGASRAMQRVADMDSSFAESIEPRIKTSKRLENINMEIITIDENEDVQSVIDGLMEDESIESVQEDVRREYLSIPNDPLYNLQWGLTNENIDVIRAWELLEGGDEVVVAVVDSGIYAEHEDLESRIVSGGRSFSYPYSDSNTNDTNGHGTWVSGVIAAQTNNNTGIAGVSGEFNVGILPLKVEPTGIDVVSAIDYAVSMNVDVINISMGGSYYEAEEKAIQRAINNNIVVVASAGNEGHEENKVQYPAGFGSVISVGSIDSNEEISYFSNYNSAVDLVAPGESIFTTDADGEYSMVDGTSFSSPYVAGICAMLKSMDKSLTPSEIENILTSTAIDRGEEGKDNYYGHGIINPVGAINSILVEDEEYEYVNDMANVPLDKEWTIKFNTELDSDTVNVSNIYIIDSKYSFVDCNLSLLSDKKSVTIIPEANYNPDEEYSLIINQDVKSTNDKNLVKSVRMKFTTED
ncbi:S8 family serine peptidase [Wukongibacter baidiensis]|uniref:S8 family serine peptidase n=1 Tax=Wukongibacter baidiensis TaxID=1723361 RepID=UPI003D7F7866